MARASIRPLEHGVAEVPLSNAPRVQSIYKTLMHVSRTSHDILFNQVVETGKELAGREPEDHFKRQPRLNARGALAVLKATDVSCAFNPEQKGQVFLSERPGAPLAAEIVLW